MALLLLPPPLLLLLLLQRPGPVTASAARCASCHATSVAFAPEKSQVSVEGSIDEQNTSVASSSCSQTAIGQPDRATNSRAATRKPGRRQRLGASVPSRP